MTVKKKDIDSEKDYFDVLEEACQKVYEVVKS
jgi:hypothetical protein